jgi:hypothetical protein
MNPMKSRLNSIWIFIFIVLIFSAVFLLQDKISPASELPFDTTTAAITPILTPAYEGCAYTWAYHDIPELTKKVNSLVRAIDPAATANATAFGEDCIYADGNTTFAAMETDFYVHFVVKDLTSEETFGNWMAKVLPLIVKLPREEIQGNYGFVEFSFEETEMKKLIVRVPIQRYIDEARGKDGMELFHLFYTTP